MTCQCLPVDEGLISIYLRRAYVTFLHHPLLKHDREGSCLQAILFQICYEYKFRRFNNILIIDHVRDTDIRQCIHNHTHLIYCVNSSYSIALIMRCLFASERMQDGVGLGQVKKYQSMTVDSVTSVDGTDLIKIIQ